MQKWEALYVVATEAMADLLFYAIVSTEKII
jgi:hypothetical protein